MPYHCSQFEKGRIIQLRCEGLTGQQIANVVGRTVKTIRKWFRRFEEGEPEMEPRAKPGRNRTTTAEQDQAMVEVSRLPENVTLVVHHLLSRYQAFSLICMEPI